MNLNQITSGELVALLALIVVLLIQHWIIFNAVLQALRRHGNERYRGAKDSDIEWQFLKRAIKAALSEHAKEHNRE